MGIFDFFKSKSSDQYDDMVKLWLSIYPDSQKFNYEWGANEATAKIPIAYKGVVTDLSHDATELHRLSGLKNVAVTTVNGNGDLWVLPFEHSITIGKTEYKTFMFFFYKTQTGLKALSINLSADYHSLLKSKERLILFDGVARLHSFNEFQQSKIPIDILLKNTKCFLPIGFIEELRNEAMTGKTIRDLLIGGVDEHVWQNAKPYGEIFNEIFLFRHNDDLKIVDYIKVLKSQGIDYKKTIESSGHGTLQYHYIIDYGFNTPERLLFEVGFTRGGYVANQDVLSESPSDGDKVYRLILCLKWREKGLWRDVTPERHSVKLSLDNGKYLAFFKKEGFTSKERNYPRIRIISKL